MDGGIAADIAVKALDRLLKAEPNGETKTDREVIDVDTETKRTFMTKREHFKVVHTTEADYTQSDDKIDADKKDIKKTKKSNRSCFASCFKSK